METLPAELLERVLSALAPADLVVVRGVSRRWRAAVAALAERDRALCFHCGGPDVEAVQQPAFEISEFGERTALACTCGVLASERALVLGDKALPVLFQYQEGKRRRIAEAKARQKGAYRKRHSSNGDDNHHRWPPARWEVLARERALALQVTQLGVRLAQDVQCLDFAVESRSYSCTYLPSWVYLPESMLRPRSAPALCALVRAVFADGAEAGDTTIARLAATPEAARAFYTEAEAAWKAEALERAQDTIGSSEEDPAFQERRAAFFAAYANGPARSPHSTYPGERAIDDADGAIEQAFVLEERRRFLRPNADWHDAWTVDSLVTEGDFEDDYFHGVVDELRKDNQGRPAPFNWATSQQIEVSDPSGWSTWQWHARTLAAAIRRCVLKGWRRKVIVHVNDSLLRVRPADDDNEEDEEEEEEEEEEGDEEEEEGGEETQGRARWKDAQLIKVGERAVATVDAVKEAIAALVRLPVVVDIGKDEHDYWVGGLSPAGHLVGTMTYQSSV